MSQINVRNLSNENEDGAPDIVGVSTFSATSYMVPPVGNTKQRPQNPQGGDLRFNTDTASLEYFRGDTLNWSQIEMTSPDLNGGARALFMGGYSPGDVDTVDYNTISTLGNSIDFGNLSSARRGGAGCGSRVRALMCAGDGTGGDPSNRIDYHEFSSLGDFIDFGDMQGSGRENSSACSDGMRGIIWGGGNPSRLDTIDYVTIASPGNGVDFGNMQSARGGGGSFSSSTRGIYVSGQGPASPWNINTIDYITIVTTGNAADFGDSTTSNTNRGGSNSIRGITCGHGGTNVMEYLTIATLGNTIDFGDLTAAKSSIMNGNSSSPTRLLLGGGYTSDNVNAIDYVEIMTTGNAKDFGDLTDARRYGGAISNAHGGL